MVPMWGGSHSPGHVRRWLDGITLGPGPIVKSLMNLAFCFRDSHLDYKAPQVMVLFWLRNTLVHKMLLTRLEEGLPSRSRELQRARRKGGGNGRIWEAFGNRHHMSFSASYPALIAAQKGCLGNAPAQNRAQVRQYRCVVLSGMCVCVCCRQGLCCKHLVLLTSSVGHRSQETVNILPILSYL